MKKLLSITLLCVMLFSTLSLFSCNTPAPTNSNGYKVALDLTDEWNKISNGTKLVQGCVVIRKEFAEQNPGAVSAFLDEYKSSIEYTNANPNEAGELIEKYGIDSNSEIASMAIPNCNIAYMEGSAMKDSLSAFLTAMHSIAPASVGNKLPSDDFYYTRNDTVEKTGTTINVATLNGTTGYGMAKLMEDASTNTTTNNYSFNVVSDPTMIIAGLANGSIDIGALPTNAASNVYNKTNGKVQALAINTLGVLYVLDKTDSVKSLADLEGKTIYAPAQNPTFILKYILAANNINATIDSTTYSSPNALETAAENGLVDIAVLPEPKVSNVMNK
ncbi:MAG: hypothetical protein IJ400_01720 [Clostridia bacterium]|nr:hypothetical protein [Clostridia bacterium]